MSLPKDKAWFPAKTYGYGWGFPSRWQGWLIFAGYFLALAAGVFLFAHKSVPLLVAYTFLLSGVLIAICAWKGEAPHWRWGDE
jgi:lipoprotein signal peptidase